MERIKVLLKESYNQGRKIRDFQKLIGWIIPSIVIVGIAVFLIAKLRVGQIGTGTSPYAMNAQNILHGLPYAKTPYLLNPANVVNPAAYPPGLPLLFVPVIHYFGFELMPLKVECALSLVIFLAAFFGVLLEIRCRVLRHSV